MKQKQYLHFSQAYGISVPNNDLDFFDVNLAFDSKLFVDPFLFKRSPIDKEKKLYKRFEIYFQEVLRRSLEVVSGKKDKEYLYEFLEFPEPKEVCLGYTEVSTNGAGLGREFASSMTNFFLKGLAKRLVGDPSLYEDSNFDPNVFIIFAEKVAEDGISDLTINLMMDYLVEFTQEQCKKLNIKTKILPVRQSFDFNDMEWSGGQNYLLPENPLKKGTPVILVPKHLLREDTVTSQIIKSKAIGILRTDPNLKEKFANLANKAIGEITVDEIKDALIQDETLLKRFIKILEYERREPYDFDIDYLEFLAIRKYEKFFKNFKLPKNPKNCEELNKIVSIFINIFKEEFELRDMWRECWRSNRAGTEVEKSEVSWGRIFRAMGISYFSHYPDITFDPEVDTGSGCLDFRVVYLSCRISIELKKLSNNSLKGESPNTKIPSYLHGIERQLPRYSMQCKSQYAYYITGQHRIIKSKEDKIDHSIRAIEIKEKIPEVSKRMKKEFSDFKKLYFINIDLSPKPSTSNI